MRTVTPFNAPGLFEPPTYTQAIKVHQAQTLLFLSGQIAYTPKAARPSPATSRRRRAARTRRSRRWWNPRAARWRTW